MSVIYISVGLFCLGVSIYGYWLSPRTKGGRSRLLLQPGLMGLALLVGTLAAPHIPEGWKTGPTGFVLWVVGLGPLVIWWGYVVMRDLLALKRDIHR